MITRLHILIYSVRLYATPNNLFQKYKNKVQTHFINQKLTEKNQNVP